MDEEYREPKWNDFSILKIESIILSCFKQLYFIKNTMNVYLKNRENKEYKIHIFTILNDLVGIDIESHIWMLHYVILTILIENNNLIFLASIVFSVELKNIIYHNFQSI